MPIPFSCPHCRLETLVDDEYSGQSGICAGCGRPITVPFVRDSDRLLNAGEIVVGTPHRRRTVAMLVAIVVGSVVAGGVLLSVLVGVLFPAVNAARSTAHKHRCNSNLERIAEAMFLYEANHGSFPPAFVADAAGKPLHSWRVLLLPYLDEGGLHVQYNLDQPWDSAANQQLATRMPRVFACPADPDAVRLGETNYMVVVGPNTLFPGQLARSSNDVSDDLGTSLLVVETPANGVNWLQPVDLSVWQMQFVINGQLGKEIGSRHEGGAYAAMADGRVHFLSDLNPADYLSGMSTIDGGERIPDIVLQEDELW